jgi:DNA polymerase elongation subunit (family B)
LAVEKRYNLCVLPKAKKAYFGILPDGTPDIKGVTPMKSNSPRFINAVFQQCVKALSVVKSQAEYENAKKAIKEIARKAIGDLKGRRVRLEDLVYSVRLYFDPNEKIADMKTAAQQYQCALQLIDAGRRLKRGDTVTFVKVRPFKYREKMFTVKPAEFVKGLAEINVEDYVRNLLTALNQTFEPMGIKLEREKETEISKWLTD